MNHVVSKFLSCQKFDDWIIEWNVLFEGRLLYYYISYLTVQHMLGSFSVQFPLSIRLFSQYQEKHILHYKIFILYIYIYFVNGEREASKNQESWSLTGYSSDSSFVMAKWQFTSIDSREITIKSPCIPWSYH